MLNILTGHKAITILAHWPIRNKNLTPPAFFGIIANMTPADLIQLILGRLEETGLSASEASTLAVGNHYLIRNMQRRGGAPSFEALQALCRVLGLEFYIGPPRGLATPETETPESGDKEIEALGPAWARRLRSGIRQDLHQALDQVSKLVPASEASDTRYVEVRQLSAAAGGGATDLDETVAGYVPFPRQWLDRHGLVANYCSVIGVMGESMEPTLPEGATILIDRSRSRPTDSRIYVVRSPDGLVVKRAAKDPGGGWWLTSDHPNWKPVQWPSQAQVIGEVRWVGKSL